jgi:hypothetical protein
MIRRAVGAPALPKEASRLVSQSGRVHQYPRNTCGYLLFDDIGSGSLNLPFGRSRATASLSALHPGIGSGKDPDRQPSLGIGSKRRILFWQLEAPFIWVIPSRPTLRLRRGAAGRISARDTEPRRHGAEERTPGKEPSLTAWTPAQRILSGW